MARDRNVGQFPALDREIHKLITGFRETEHWQRLSKDAQRDAEYIITFFAGQALLQYRYFPRNWTDQAVHELLTGVFVKKLFFHGVITRDSFFIAVKPVLGAFFDYLLELGNIHEEQHKELRDILPSAAAEMRFVIAQRRQEDGGIYDGDEDLFDDDGENFDDDDLEDGDFDEDEDDDFLDYLKAELGRLIKNAARNNRRRFMGTAGLLGKRRAKDSGCPPPAIRQWDTLLTLANKIRQREPWRNLHSGDLILIDLPERDEPLFCSVTGDAPGEMLGVAVYPDYGAATALLCIENDLSDVPASFLMGITNSLTCVFGEKADLEQEDREIISKLGIKYGKGKNDWPIFRLARPGFYPWFMDKTGAELMIGVLEQLDQAIAAIQRQETTVDIDANLVLRRSWSAGTGTWEQRAVPFPEIPLENRRHVTNNTFLIRQIAREKQVELRMELDIIFFPIPIYNGNGPPCLPRLVLFGDSDDGTIIDQDIFEDDRENPVILLEALGAFISEYGKPLTIYCRNEQIELYLTDFCQKTGIDLKLKHGGVPVINEAVQEILEEIDYLAPIRKR
ncbi:MAG: hypothetical protein LBS64_02490 [Spirochaetaceae bacterium]|jgi:hypothetical protein|nr:hypothetical protein [Spirochaetaceae bacterium]